MITQISNKITQIFIIILTIICINSICFGQEDSEKSTVEQPIIVNGDVVEYSTDAKEVTATGNVVVIYKGTKLTCEKLTVNTETKDAQAEGNARLDDKGGVIEGTKMIYNFQTKTGTIIDPEFRSNPYFGKSEKADKVSDEEFISRWGYTTTCSYDNPHYRIKSRRVNLFPGDKIQTRDSTFYAGRIPLFYLPRYNHSLKDPLLHVQLMPGKTKVWGNYLLTAWRYNLTDDITGRIYLDYRERMGMAEGFGVNYTTQDLGKGDFKYYYTRQRERRLEEGVPAEFQRYFIRSRHKWEADDGKTNAVIQYYKIVDSKKRLSGTETGTGISIPYDFSNADFLKDYFFREYEKDTQPLSYITVHRSFYYSSLDFLMQKRINRWYSQAEYLPQITYTLPSIQMGESPFYFENSGSCANYNYKNAVPSDRSNDITYNSYNTTNKFSLPMKIAFFNLNPSISNQMSVQDKKGIYGSTLQVNFSCASDLSTKFYRIFNLKTNFLGLNINKIRHIITPSISYTYSKNSTMPSNKFRIGGGASVSTNHPISLGLSNKLQTKRNNQSVDLFDFRISSNYTFEPKTGAKRGSSFSDFLFELELRPYSWMRFATDTTYNHSGLRSDTAYRHFSNANYNINLDFGKERSISLGQRYQRKGGNDVSLSINWRLSPKWKFSFYQRRNRGHSPLLKRGLREQEYSISRDLHCWTVDFTYNVRRGEGESIWLVFRLKAFPELEFNYDQQYHVPKFGSQSNP